MANNAAPALALALLLWIVIAAKLAAEAELRTFGSFEYPSIATLFVAVAIASFGLISHETTAAAAACGVTCIALVIAAEADARHGLLFDAVTLPAAILSAAIGVCFGDPAATAAGVAMLVGIFGAVYVVTRRRSIGLGDVKAMFAIGAAFGPLESLLTILAACVTGIAGALIAGRLRRGASIRFGPHLAAGSTLTLLFGRPFVHHVMGL
jgi:prepilin signal peptidase PulO-like enzyme (type II secretory pathway)